MLNMGWYSRNDQGFWCNVCGNHLKPAWHLDDDEEWEDFETELEDGLGCDQCGAPDDIDPDAI